jgi:hypothetical protein
MIGEFDQLLPPAAFQILIAFCMNMSNGLLAWAVRLQYRG